LDTRDCSRTSWSSHLCRGILVQNGFKAFTVEGIAIEMYGNNNRAFPSAFGSKQKKEKPVWLVNQEQRDREKKEKERTQQDEKEKEEKGREFNEFNFPRLGNYGWGEERESNFSGASFADLAAEWSEKQENESKRREDEELREILAQRERQRANIISFNRPSSYHQQIDHTEEEERPVPVADEWVTVRHKKPYVPKKKSTLHVESVRSAPQEEEEYEDYVAQERSRGSIW